MWRDGFLRARLLGGGGLPGAGAGGEDGVVRLRVRRAAALRHLFLDRAWTRGRYRCETRAHLTVCGTGKQRRAVPTPNASCAVRIARAQTRRGQQNAIDPDQQVLVCLRRRGAPPSVQAVRGDAAPDFSHQEVEHILQPLAVHRGDDGGVIRDVVGLLRRCSAAEGTLTKAAAKEGALHRPCAPAPAHAPRMRDLLRAMRPRQGIRHAVSSLAGCSEK